MRRPLERSLSRSGWLALAYAALAIASLGIFGVSLWSVVLPAALMLAVLFDGIARPGSSVLYPTVTHGSREGRLVALSFDDGPDPDVTPAVLDVLARYGARATFFTIGRLLQAQPMLASRMLAEHHELGNHSWTHSRWQNFFGARRHLREMMRGARPIAQVPGAPAHPVYRPPMGFKSPLLARAARRLQLTVVGWSLHGRDTNTHDPQRIARRVLKKIRPGDIVLMHDGHDAPGHHRPHCAQALPQILEGLREKGLQCVTVSELLQARRPDETRDWAQELGRGLVAHFGLKMLAGWLLAGGFFLGYFLLLRFPLFPVTLMPVIAPDRWIAFWPGALWLYVSLWVYVSLAPGLLTDRQELLDYYRAMIALSVAGMAVFLLWPTASPRPVIDWMQHPPFGPMIAADEAGNAFPSLHAAFAVFTAIWVHRLLHRAGAPGWTQAVNALWAFGIVYSTLATRQHVAVDVIAGTALGWLAAVLHRSWLRLPRPRAAATASGPEPPVPSIVRSDAELLEANRRFYDTLWRDSRLIAPERFNTWPLVRSMLSRSARRLEVAPGLRPRLPIEGTQFVDISAPALACLGDRGGRVLLGGIHALPFPDRSFDLVCALDIVEHVDDEDGALSELSRVAAPGAALLLSVPLHPEQWTAFDDFVGHRRRYEPSRLQSKLVEHGFAVEQSAVYGMQPKSSRLLDLGMWFLVHRRERAMWWYNHVFMPLGVRFQKKLELVPGLIDRSDVAEIILVCRKA